MKEQADISSTRNGDTNTTTKLEQARIHCNIHKKPDNSIEGKPVRDDNEGTDIIENTSADTFNPDAAISIARTARTTNAGATNSSNTSRPSTAGNNDHSSSIDHNHTYDLGGFSFSNGKLAYDPGGDSLNTKDGASRDDDDK